MHRLIALLLAVAALGIAGCSDGHNSAQQNETKIQQNGYTRLAANQPAHSMQYSPTRDQINFWVDTWGKKPGKPSYVYLQNEKGDITGYYVFKGLPVSYCAALTPTYQLVGTPHDGSNALNQQVPAPSIDGVYYGSGSGLCNTYYGRDLTTNSYMEFTVGVGQNTLVYERPVPAHANAQPLGFTTIAESKK
jgi:hypothetical protein